MVLPRVLLLIPFLACLQGQPPAPAVPPDTVVAEVAGKKYTAAEVDRIMALYPPQMQMSVRNDPKRAFESLLLMQHLAEEASKEKLDQQSPLKETLEFQRIYALMQAEVTQKRNFDVKVEPDDEQKYYKQHPDRYQEAKVKVIYIAFGSSPVPASPEPGSKKLRSEPEAKAKIEELRKRLDAGEDFGKLARENSDDKESAAKDGEFGSIQRGSQLPDEIKNAVFALKPGQVSNPVRQKNGFYLLRVESLTTQPYDQVRTQIFDELKQQGFNKWFADIQKRYEVKVENPAYFTAKPSVPGQQIVPQAR